MQSTRTHQKFVFPQKYPGDDYFIWPKQIKINPKSLKQVKYGYYINQKKPDCGSSTDKFV